MNNKVSTNEEEKYISSNFIIYNNNKDINKHNKKLNNESNKINEKNKNNSSNTSLIC